MNRIVIFLVTLLLLPILTARGQSAGSPAGQKFMITGLVSDGKKNAPLEYANVVIKSSTDSSLIGGTYSGKTGEFLLPNVAEGSYSMKVSYVGYVTKEIPGVEVKGANPKVDIGSIKLEPTAVAVEGVSVEGERATEEYRLDKKVINVSQSMHATGGTALDVLQNQPSVRVDADGNVTLRGSSNFTVLVNGRPGVFQGADALRQIPSNIIENIELITNPSAKYEAEGSAGIININTKAQTESSVNGIMNAGTGSRNKYNTDATINYIVNSFTLMGGFDYRRNTFYQKQDVDRISHVSAGEMINTTRLNRIDTRDQYTGRYGIDYNLDEQNMISLSGNGGNLKINRNMNLNINNKSPLSDDFVHTTNGMDLTADYFNSVAYYKHKVNAEGTEVTGEASYTNVWMPYEQKTNEYRTDMTYSNWLPNPRSQKMNTALQRNEGRVKLNYTLNLAPQSTFESGVQSNFSYRDMNIGNLYYDWINLQWLVDTTLTNTYNFRNNVHAAFVTYSNVVYECDVQLGLRTEYMDRLLQQKTMGSDYGYDKLDWFPSLSVSRKIDDHQLQFSFSRRIDRPNEAFLNPFPYYTDTYLTSKGNPQLLPEYTNSFELNYQKTFSGIFVSAQTYLRASTGSVNQEISIDTTGRMISMFTNFDKTTTTGIELSASYSPLTWLRLDPNVNFYDYSMDGDLLGEAVQSHSFAWTSRLTSTVTISPTTRLMVTGSYQGKQMFPQGEVDPVFNLNISAKQDFFSKALSFTLQGQNLLPSSNYNISANGPNFRNSFVVKPEVPIINLLVSYNFNNYKRPERPTERVDVNVGM